SRLQHQRLLADTFHLAEHPGFETHESTVQGAVQNLLRRRCDRVDSTPLPATLHRRIREHRAMLARRRIADHVDAFSSLGIGASVLHLYAAGFVFDVERAAVVERHDASNVRTARACRSACEAEQRLDRLWLTRGEVERCGAEYLD